MNSSVWKLVWIIVSPITLLNFSYLLLHPVYGTQESTDANSLQPVIELNRYRRVLLRAEDSIEDSDGSVFPPVHNPYETLKNVRRSRQLGLADYPTFFPYQLNGYTPSIQNRPSEFGRSNFPLGSAAVAEPAQINSGPLPNESVNLWAFDRTGNGLTNIPYNLAFTPTPGYRWITSAVPRSFESDFRCPSRLIPPPSAKDSNRPPLKTSQPIVKTDKGLVRGKKMVSRLSKDYYAFTSIPYAKPPVGPLRFERPVPADEWPGIRSGPDDLPECWQIQVLNPFLNNLTYGTEDCLYLSVFTPQVGRNRKLPVMVYLLGGAYRSEFPPMSQATRAKYLMDENIVLVVFKYRVAAFGFLSLEGEVLPGNMGLKDTALALNWVSKNIQEFGGDPNSVTVFGNSVGGATVQYVLTSPMTKNLVKGGISQSGTANCLWALAAPGVARYRTLRLAENVGCPTTSDKELLECLKSKPPFEIADADRIFISRDFDPALPFQPVLETGPDCFICESPYKVPVEKPWIIGVNKDEGAFKTVWYILKPELMENFKNNNVDFIHESLMFTNSTSNPDEVARAVLETYANKNLTELWTDGFFFSGVSPSLKMARAPTYFYAFSHRGQTSIIDLLGQHGNVTLPDLGVSHVDELLYLFNFEDINVKLSSEDEKVSRTMVTFWTNFAKTGKPTLDAEWPPYDESNKRYLNISTTLRIDCDLWPERRRFWESLPIRNVMEQNNL